MIPIHREFSTYFKTYYAGRETLTCTYCFQKGLGINTNIYLEKYLKYVYFCGHNNKRLDTCIDALEVY